MSKEYTILQAHTNLRQAQGDYEYRIKQPGEAMGRIQGIQVVDCYVHSPHFKDLCLNADLLILHLVWEADIIPIISERKHLGLPTIYEISDNFLGVPDSVTHIASVYKKPFVTSSIFQLIQLSDAIQGVSSILMDRFSFLHAHRMVFENHLMQVPELSRAPTENITIGWAGSMGHTEDLKWIAPLVKDICLAHPQVHFSFMGGKEQYDEVFGNIANEQFTYRSGGTLGDYFNFLEGIDIGLAPLLDTPFNICRSDVKFIEYASRGVVPVLSDTGPYRIHARHGVNAFLFDGSDSLKDVLETLIGNRALLEKVREAAYAYVKKERLEQDHAGDRISLYKKLIGKRPSVSLPFEILDKIAPDSDYYQVKQTPAEKKLVQGITLRNQGNVKMAKKLLWSSASETQNYYFPLLILAEISDTADLDQMVEAVRLSLTMNPESLRGRLMLGQLIKSKDIEAARKQFELALTVFPDFAPALFELAVIENEKGRMDQSARLMDRALQANPFFSPAAHFLGRILLVQERIHRAIEAFRVAADLDPDNESYRIDLIRALTKAGKLDEVEEECNAYLNLHPESLKVRRIYEEFIRLPNSREEMKKTECSDFPIKTSQGYL